MFITQENDLKIIIIFNNLLFFRGRPGFDPTPEYNDKKPGVKSL